jgi:hypothetical protein
MSGESFENSEDIHPDVEEFEDRILAVAEEPRNIEYEVQKTVDTAEVEYNRYNERKTGNRLPKKARLMESIEKFRGYLPELIPTPNKLKKTRIADLEKLLARCVATSAGLQMKKEYREEAETEAEVEEGGGEGGGGGAGININSKQTGARTLYMANLGLVSVIEQVSRQTCEYTGVIVEGWSDDIKNDKEQLMQILEGVYAENASIVQTYMSPTSVWALYMLSSGAGHLKGARPLQSSQE